MRRFIAHFISVVISNVGRYARRFRNRTDAVAAVAAGNFCKWTAIRLCKEVGNEWFLLSFLIVPITNSNYCRGNNPFSQPLVIHKQNCGNLVLCCGVFQEWRYCAHIWCVIDIRRAAFNYCITAVVVYRWRRAYQLLINSQYSCIRA